MDRVVRARILAAVAFAGAAGLAWFSLWGSALALLTMGAAALLLVTERDVPPSLPEGGADGAVRALAGLTRELRLVGRGVVVPPREGNGPAALYIGAGDVATLPAMERGEVAIHTSGARGVQLPPPGLGLERQAAQLAGLPEGGGAEEAVVHLQRSFRALELGRDVRVARANNAFRVSYEPISFADTCRATREELAPWHQQGGCPACSLVMLTLARAHGRPVRVNGAGSDGGRVYLDLEVLA